jgi:hypothetical protein
MHGKPRLTSLCVRATVNYPRNSFRGARERCVMIPRIRQRKILKPVENVPTCNHLSPIFDGSTLVLNCCGGGFTCRICKRDLTNFDLATPPKNVVK